MSSDTSSGSTSLLSLPSPPPSPTAARRRPQSLRLNHIGLDPTELIGKIIQRARRSPTHPALTLDFSDNTAVQILVDGYDPTHRGIPKQLDMDGDLNSIFSNPESLNLPIVDCALITLQDTAFDRKNTKSPSNAVYWDQKHLAVAFKFAEQHPHWHCIWARMEEHDEQLDLCVFRSYDDVYLERLHRTPRKPKWRNSMSRYRAMAS